MLNFWRFFLIVIDLLFFLISVDAQNIVYHEDSQQVVSREELNEKIKQQERVFYEKPHEVAHEIIQLYELALQYKDTTALLRIFRLMNYVFNVQGEHDEQIKYSLQQIKLAESLRDTSQIIEACLSLSNAYQSLQNREIALRYSLDAQKLAEQIKDNVALGRAFLNVSEEYRKTKDFGIANMYAEKANEHFQKSKQPYYEALCQFEFGKIALDKDEYDNAQKYFQKTLQLLENLSPYDKARVLICMGKLYRHKSQYAKSHQYLQESLVLAQAIEAKPLLVRVYHELSITNEANGDLAKALSYYKLYKQHHDELVTKTHNIRTNTLQYHYDKTKKEKEIELLSKNQLLNLQIIRDQEREKYWLIIGISLLAAVIIVTGGSYFYRSKQNKMLKLQNEEIQKQKMHIEQQNLLLSQKNAALDKLNEEKDYMLGIAAHDLKSPLKQIIGLVSIIRLENDTLTENQKDYLTRIEDSCNRLNSLIDKILDLDALRTNTKNLTIQKIDLTQILSALALDFQDIALKKGITIYKNFDKNAYVMADSHYTMQIFQNLISNAIKFSPLNKNVYLNVKNNSHKVVVEVKDEGPGFTDQDKEKLFGKFQKLSAQPTAGEKSSGLGLSIVKKFTDLMGATIRCESQYGNGACFIVEFDKAD